MASKACIHCHQYVPSDSNSCPLCGKPYPFGDQCPKCHAIIKRGQDNCPDCGEVLMVVCPHCAGNTFPSDRCDQCGESLMMLCTHKNCGEPQFFTNTVCTVCHKKLKLKITKSKIA